MAPREQHEQIATPSSFPECGDEDEAGFRVAGEAHDFARGKLDRTQPPADVQNAFNSEDLAAGGPDGDVGVRRMQSTVTTANPPTVHGLASSAMAKPVTMPGRVGMASAPTTLAARSTGAWASRTARFWLLSVGTSLRRCSWTRLFGATSPEM